MYQEMKFRPGDMIQFIKSDDPNRVGAICRVIKYYPFSDKLDLQILKCPSDPGLVGQVLSGIFGNRFALYYSTNKDAKLLLKSNK